MTWLYLCIFSFKLAITWRLRTQYKSTEPHVTVAFFFCVSLSVRCIFLEKAKNQKKIESSKRFAYLFIKRINYRTDMELGIHTARFGFQCSCVFGWLAACLIHAHLEISIEEFCLLNKLKYHWLNGTIFLFAVWFGSFFLLVSCISLFILTTKWKFR